MLIKAGRQYWTRDGSLVTIFRVDGPNNETPVHGRFEGGYETTWTIDGYLEPPIFCPCCNWWHSKKTLSDLIGQVQTQEKPENTIQGKRNSGASR